MQKTPEKRNSLDRFDATALRMNYSACNMAMIVILPDKKSSLTSLEKQLTDISLEALSSVMNLEKVDVKIPSFTAEFQQELSQAFILMGMNRMFSGQAELGRILKSQESLFVSKIVHKSFIEVNEVGTEAAAATAVAATFRSMPAPQCPPKAFRANRPFFYAIIDNTHGLLFAGHFVTARVENSKHVTHVPKETDARMKE
ncbi:antitrypsin isoform X4 [Drosophila teissieri]|uniref:antitrypsin isoform X4 n=1 Tax=Drosophila teissieri TaxID=7243 RepID=UPI001CBA4B26|nr:antitrypsin isoform X4 [Drosophila teissieri]